MLYVKKYFFKLNVISNSNNLKYNYFVKYD